MTMTTFQKGPLNIYCNKHAFSWFSALFVIGIGTEKSEFILILTKVTQLKQRLTNFTTLLCISQFLFFSACQQAEVDLVIAIDSSNVTDDCWTKVKAFLQDVLRGLPLGLFDVRVGIVVFNNVGKIVLQARPAEH